MPAQESLLRDIAKDEFCGCDSPLTLSACLEKKPDCQLGSLLGQVLARAIEQGASRHTLATFLAQGVVGPFCSPSRNIPLTGAGRLGSKTAPITLIEFADFRCTHCRDAAAAVHAAIEGHEAEVQLLYAPVALGEQAPSLAAAEAVLAAGSQQKFWPMHAALFAHEGDFDSAGLLSVAKKAKLNVAQFQRDMQTHRFADAVRSFNAAATAAGITGTPAFFVNGRPYSPIPHVFDFPERFAMEQKRGDKACN